MITYAAPVLIKNIDMRFRTQNSRKKVRYGLFKCFCGNEFSNAVNSVQCGNVKSCGCLKLTSIRSLNKQPSDCLLVEDLGMMETGNKGLIDHYGIFKCPLCHHNFKSLFKNIKNFHTKSCGCNHQIFTRASKRIYKNNTSGYRGVSFNKANSKWIATIRLYKTPIYLGSFYDPIQAARAYDNYVIEHNLEHTRNFS